VYSRFGGNFPLKTYNRLPGKPVPEKPHWRAFVGHYMERKNGVFLRTGPKFQPDFRHVRFAMYLPVFLESGSKSSFTVRVSDQCIPSRTMTDPRAVQTRKRAGGFVVDPVMLHPPKNLC